MTARGLGHRTAWRHAALAGVLLLAAILSGCADPASSVMAPPVASPQRMAATSVSVPTTGDVTPTGDPVSRFEDDPAVKALRTHYVGLAKSVNLRTADVPELNRTSTRRRREVNRRAMRVDYGLYYPGPVPFTPVSVRTVDARTRQIRICVLGEGWGQDRETGIPANSRKVSALQAILTQVRGRWLVDRIDQVGGSCSGVTIDEVSW